MSQTIQIEDHVTVGTLAEKLSIPVSRLITELMKNGIMATINERLDYDTAQIIVNELGLDMVVTRQEVAPKEIVSTRTKLDVKSDKAVPRPPVVAFMGHVDHGKTSLLDAIKSSQVAKEEAGGITQYISAYYIKHNGRAITFLDTPGHEAFSAIREHGVRLTDIAVIVIAADDGIKPQTIEAIRFAKQAKVKIIVAINKIDKEGADSNRVKQQLADQDLLVEEWGGNIVTVEVSAKNKQGIDNLLDMILLVADVEDLRAEVDVPAKGLIIEAHTEIGRGSVAHALVEWGTLKKGDYIVAGTTYARIKNLETTDGQPLVSATPSMPVVITGFKTLPEFGDEFEAVSSEKIAKVQVQKVLSSHHDTSGRLDLSSSDLIRLINRTNKVQFFNIIIKADVRGSLASVADSLKVLDTDEVAVCIVDSGIGMVTENDIYIAKTSGAVIYSFNVNVPNNIKRLAARDKVVIRSYTIIYELIDDVKAELSKLLLPEIVETVQGFLTVKAIFKTTKTELICGGEVSKGPLSIPARGRIIRDKKVIAEGEIINLKRGPQDVQSVQEKELCGVSVRTENRLDLQVADRIEFFTRQTIERKL
ncbi:MAG: translation initiation factor IF-2 [Candidatus Saccharimonadales bacterium]|jgi:translation initiation factor IF-2